MKRNDDDAQTTEQANDRLKLKPRLKQQLRSRTDYKLILLASVKCANSHSTHRSMLIYTHTHTRDYIQPQSSVSLITVRTG